MEYSQKIRSVSYVANGKSLKVKSYLQATETIEDVLRDIEARYCDYVEVTTLTGKVLKFTVQSQGHCNDQDSCEEDHCRCLSFIPIK